MSEFRMLENANKITYLMECYPEHSVAQIINLVQLPAIDINAAIWYATELGYIGEPSDETGIAPLLKKPKTWNFGEMEQGLESELLYCFEQLAKKETDLEETYLSNWTAGYSSQDTMIALRRLEQTKKLVQYNLEDGKDDYTFFTLYENREQLWGRKQFKKDPLPGKEPKA